MYMDGRPSPCGGHPTHAHFRHARSRRLDEPTQLRASQCDGVRGSSSHCAEQVVGVMSNLIDEADAKRRCMTAGSASGPKQ